jgi:hypothetical protein
LANHLHLFDENSLLTPCNLADKPYNRPCHFQIGRRTV